MAAWHAEQVVDSQLCPPRTRMHYSATRRRMQQYESMHAFICAIILLAALVGHVHCQHVDATQFGRCQELSHVYN